MRQAVGNRGVDQTEIAHPAGDSRVGDQSEKAVEQACGGSLEPGLPLPFHGSPRFSRFYTRKIGILHEGLLGSPLSLAEGRVIWELAQCVRATASELAAELGLDSGYLSRILAGFEGRGLIERRPSERDGRRVMIALSAAGQALYAAIDARSREAVAAMLGELDGADQVRLVAALEAAERVLAPGRKDGGPAYILRPHQPGECIRFSCERRYRKITLSTQRRVGLGPSHLAGGGFPAGARGAALELRARPRRAVLGVAAEWIALSAP
jgi:DNA-binding MarR family transcriptional regulator